MLQPGFGDCSPLPSCPGDLWPWQEPSRCACPWLILSVDPARVHSCLKGPFSLSSSLWVLSRVPTVIVLLAMWEKVGRAGLGCCYLPATPRSVGTGLLLRCDHAGILRSSGCCWSHLCLFPSEIRSRPSALGKCPLKLFGLLSSPKPCIRSKTSAFSSDSY